MRTRFIIALIAIFQIGLLTSVVAYAAEPLRWKFTKGERFRYDMTQQMENAVDAGTGGMITTEVDQTMNMFWTIKDVSPEGNATIVQSFDRIRMTMAMPGGAGMEYDSDSEDPPQGLAALVAPVFDALRQAEITVVMAPTGEVLESKVPESLINAMKNAPGAQLMGDMASKEGLQQMATQGSMKFPEGAFEVGEELTNSIEMKNPVLGKLVVDTKHTYKGPTTVDGDEYESFTPSIKMSIEKVDAADGPDPAPGLPRPSNVKITGQDSSGEVLFSRTKGRLSSMKTEQKFTMEMTVNGRQVKSTVKQQLGVTVKPIGIVETE